MHDNSKTEVKNITLDFSPAESAKESVNTKFTKLFAINKSLL